MHFRCSKLLESCNNCIAVEEFFFPTIQLEIMFCAAHIDELESSEQEVFILVLTLFLYVINSKNISESWTKLVIKSRVNLKQ